MEHPEAGVAEAEAAEDGVAALLEVAPREAPPQRALGQVLVVVLGWAVVLAIVCVVIALVAPTIETAVVAVVRALSHAGRP